MADTLSADALRDLLQVGNPHTLNLILEDAHPRDVALAAETLDDDALWDLLRLLEPASAAAVFSHLTIERQAVLAESRAPAEAADLLEQMPSDDRVDLVQQLDPRARDAILREMQPSQRDDVERLAVHPQGTVGAVMSTDVATLRSDLTIDEAVRRLRAMAGNKETIYYNYVVDAGGRLIGIVSLRDLILGDGHTRLGDVMNDEPLTLRPDEDVEAAARKIREYDLIALPVVDPAQRLVGLVTFDDLADVAEAEATEDFHKLGATGLGKQGMSEVTPWLLYRRRIVWLIVLVFVNVLSGAGIAAYEETISSVVSLVFFLPLLIASSGNAGSQAATLMVRALATGEVRMGDWLRLLGVEFAVALALGLTMAAGVSLVTAWRAPEVMTVVAVTMVVVVLFGSLLGMSLPFVFTRLELDPATASGPLITSLADISGVLIYFGLATWLLRDHIEAARLAAHAAGG
jgi:magnesium transporter